MNESFDIPRIKQFYVIYESHIINLFELLGRRRMHIHKYCGKTSRTITAAVFFPEDTEENQGTMNFKSFFCEMCFILFTSFLEITLMLCWDFLHMVLEGNDCQNVTNPIFLNVTKTFFWFNKFLIKLNGPKWSPKKPSKGGGLWSLLSKWDIVSWKRVQTELMIFYHSEKPNVEENRFLGLYYKMP